MATGGRIGGYLHPLFLHSFQTREALRFGGVSVQEARNGLAALQPAGIRLKDLVPHAAPEHPPATTQAQRSPSWYG